MEFKDFAAKVGGWLRDNICEEADLDDEVDVPMLEEKGLESCSVVYSVYIDSPCYLTSIEFFLEDLYEEFRHTGWGSVTKDMRNGLKTAGMLESAQKKISVYLDLLPQERVELFDQLRILRSTLAKENGVPPYIVFCNRTLYEMCEELPENKEDMLALPGVGEKNYSQYGEAFLSVINACTEKMLRCAEDEEETEGEEAEEETEEETEEDEEE